MELKLKKLWGRVKTAFNPKLVDSPQVEQPEHEFANPTDRDRKELYLRDDGWHLGSPEEIEGWKRDEKDIAHIIQSRSPYKHLVESANACGAFNDVDRFEAQEWEWAADELKYLKSPEVTGLLSGQAKYCLIRDFGCDQALIDVLDTSRGDRVSYAQSFNETIDSLNSSSKNIKNSAIRLLRNSELSEPEKLRAAAPTLAKVYKRFEEAVIPETNERKFWEYNKLPHLKNAGRGSFTKEYMSRGAPLVYPPTIDNKVTGPRKALMLETVETKPGPDETQQNARNKGPER